MQAINLILNTPWAGDEFKFAAVYRVSSPAHIGYEILYSDKQPWFNRNFGVYVTHGLSNDCRVQLPDTMAEIEDWQNTVVTIEKWKAVNEKPAQAKARLITQHARSAEGDDISHLSEQQRANLWIIRGSTGLSSKMIWAHMTGTITQSKSAHYPSDPDDLNRCLLLLEALPEWKVRISEMKAHGPTWAALAERWDEITQSFLDEVGLNWVNSDTASKTYDLMKKVQASADRRQ